MSDLCMTVLCPGALQERLLDALLMMQQIAIFTSADVGAHGLAHHRLSANEQVLGLAVMTQVQALMKQDDCDAVLANLTGQFAGSGLRYWITPVIGAGEFK